jgi:hypothetical protein
MFLPEFRECFQGVGAVRGWLALDIPTRPSKREGGEYSVGIDDNPTPAADRYRDAPLDRAPGFIAPNFGST